MGPPDSTLSGGPVFGVHHTRLCREGTDEARAALYRLYLDQTISQHADTILEELRRQEDFGPDDLQPHARWLIQNAAHREPLNLKTREKIRTPRARPQRPWRKSQMPRP